jgi:hypothetical protein
MDTPRQLLEGVSLAWWPTLLRSFCGASQLATETDATYSLQSADVDGLDEMTLP